MSWYLVITSFLFFLSCTTCDDVRRKIENNLNNDNSAKPEFKYTTPYLIFSMLLDVILVLVYELAIRPLLIETTDTSFMVSATNRLLNAIVIASCVLFAVKSICLIVKIIKSKKSASQSEAKKEQSKRGKR